MNGNGVDLQKIQYFLAVMDHRNYSVAAQALRVSQPTLSRQMSALENEFDAPLFVRHGRGVAPTEAANRLYEGFKGLERQLRSLKSEVGAASGELRDQVAAGVLDLAVTNLNEPMRGVTAEPLGQEPMLLVGPPDAKFAKRGAMSIDRLADFPLILTTRPNSLRLSVEAGLSRFGIRPNIRIEANTLPLMTDLVRAGLGYTVLPSCGVRTLAKSGQVSAKPIAGFSITWLMAKPKSRPLSFAAGRFCEMLRIISREQIDKGIWTLPRAWKR